jgi:hypothetical protein
MSDIKASNTTANLSIKTPPAAAEAQQPIKLQTQEEIDRETSLIRLQAEKLKLQREMLELERLTSDIEKIRAEKSNQTMSHDTVEESLKYARDDQERHQNLCTHMKGGESMALLNNAPSQGTDSGNYAFIDHTLTTGVRFRLCQRCAKTWFPRDPDYRWAMSRPTKNSPSTGCPSPGLVRNNKSEAEGGPRMVSEIPHRIAPVPDAPFGPGPQGF